MRTPPKNNALKSSLGSRLTGFSTAADYRQQFPGAASRQRGLVFYRALMFTVAETTGGCLPAPQVHSR